MNSPTLQMTLNITGGTCISLKTIALYGNF